MQNLIRKLMMSVLMIFFITLTGCAGKHGNSLINNKMNISGTWTGTVTPIERVGAITIVLHQSEHSISGQIIYQDKIGQFANINAKVIGNNIKGTYLTIPNLGQGAFSGTFINNKIDGLWYRTDGVPASGTYSIIRK